MDLAGQYERQYAWRSWPQAYAALPALVGARVLDLGCAVGDQARDLAARGAEVVGVDGDEALLACARARSIPGASFVLGDLRAPQVEGPFDGIWSSFAAAYFPDLVPVLRNWRSLLRPGGWIALTEVSGMFAHEPVSQGTRNLLDSYVREASDAGRYDFDMGAKLARHLEAAGFTVEAARVLPDRELSFSGPAEGDVLQAWGERLARMRLLQERAREQGVPLREELLGCLASADHRTDCHVHLCVARL